MAMNNSFFDDFFVFTGTDFSFGKFWLHVELCWLRRGLPGKIGWIGSSYEDGFEEIQSNDDIAVALSTFAYGFEEFLFIDHRLPRLKFRSYHACGWRIVISPATDD